MHDAIDAFGAIVDEHEAARLMPISPNANRVVAIILRGDDFATNRRRRLLPAAIPCAPRTINVVKTGDGCFEPALSPILLTEHLRHQLLPAVTTLGHGGIGIGFLQ